LYKIFFFSHESHCLLILSHCGNCYRWQAQNKKFNKPWLWKLSLNYILLSNISKKIIFVYKLEKIPSIMYPATIWLKYCYTLRNEVVGGILVSPCPFVCRQILCRTITWVVFLRIFLNFISCLLVRRGGSLSFLTIFTFAVPELLDLIWRKIGFLPYVVW
jgi:hypothetical protein